MNSSKLTLVAFAALVSLSSLASAADAFVRPVVSLAIPKSSGLDNEVGYGVAAGARFGVDSVHEMGFEVMRAEWKSDRMIIIPGVDGSAVHINGVQMEETLTPLLFNYRYRFGADESRVRFYAGPSLGVTQWKRKGWEATEGLIRVRGAAQDEWKLTIAGSVGATVKLTERVEVDVGYRYNWMDGLKDYRTHNIYIGAGIKF